MPCMHAFTRLCISSCLSVLVITDHFLNHRDLTWPGPSSEPFPAFTAINTNYIKPRIQFRALVQTQTGQDETRGPTESVTPKTGPGGRQPIQTTSARSMAVGGFSHRVRYTDTGPWLERYQDIRAVRHKSPRDVIGSRHAPSCPCLLSSPCRF
ncbi:hypothetical protein F4824DRAFT_446003 [Ustulina deusta]|nr:hypothetical protein F4824DRAFT_446003 [Ustulina deusta]